MTDNVKYKTNLSKQLDIHHKNVMFNHFIHTYVA